MSRRLALCGWLVLAACSSKPAAKTAGSTEQRTPPSPASADAAWLLAGSTDERFIKVAKHLRGFDVAMAEVAYRYAELHWAGHDRNWDYADYQLRKIETAIANGVERRPRRAASAQMLSGAVTQVRTAIAQHDASGFATAFGSLTATCNACHLAERVPFIRIAPPLTRTSIVSVPTDGPQ